MAVLAVPLAVCTPSKQTTGLGLEPPVVRAPRHEADFVTLAYAAIGKTGNVLPPLATLPLGQY